MKRFLVYTSILVIFLAGSYSLVLSYQTEASVQDAKAADSSMQYEEERQRVTRETVTVHFEGDDSVSYELKLPKVYNVEKANDSGTRVVIKEKNKTLATIFFSFEGARGFSPGDYYNEYLSSASIASSTEDAVLPDMPGLFLIGKQKEYRIIPIKEGGWLLVVDYDKSIREKVGKLLDSLQIN